MKTINLLPREEKVRDVRSIVLNIIMIVFIILFLIVAVSGYFVFDASNKLKSKLSEYENVNLSLKNYNDRLMIYYNYKDNVETKSILDADIKKNEVIWSDMLYYIADNIPEKITIESFYGDCTDLYSYIRGLSTGDEEPGEKKYSFGLQGYTEDYGTLLQYVIDLKKMPDVDGVWISEVKRVELDSTGIEVLSFLIDGYWDVYEFDFEIYEEKEVTPVGEEELLEEELSGIE